MPDYWIKITEKEEDKIQRHHYLVTARNIIEAKKSRKNSFSTSATKMMIRNWLPTVCLLQQGYHCPHCGYQGNHEGSLQRISS